MRLWFFHGKCHYNGKHLKQHVKKRSKQGKIASLFGPGLSKKPKHPENTSINIIDESSEIAECSS
jgi:hypothetical protein